MNTDGDRRGEIAAKFASRDDEDVAHALPLLRV